MARKIAFLINPIAGKGKQASIEGLVKKYLDPNLFYPRFFYSEAKNHCRELVKQACLEAEMMVAVGGDGTVNEVASELIGTDTPLGIIPAGSGNGIARNFGIPMDIKQAILLLNKHKIVKSDIGIVNGNAFLATAGCGFDAHVAQLFAGSKTRGLRSYVQIILKEFKSYKPIPVHIKIDGREISQDAFLATVANGKQFGNNAFIAPTAKTDDGIFNLTILKPFPYWAVAGIVFRLFTKSLLKSAFVETYEGREILISQEKEIGHFDGEPLLGSKVLDFRMKPLSLNVLVNA